MGRIAVVVVLGGLSGWLGGSAEGQCWCPPPVPHCGIVHPIFIESHCHCPQPCCPHPHISCKPIPQPSPPPPCPEAVAYIGRHGVLYVASDNDGFVAITVNGTMRHANIIRVTTDQDFEYFREDIVNPSEPGLYWEWAVSRRSVDGCRYSVFHRRTKGKWEEIHLACRECVSKGARPVATHSGSAELAPPPRDLAIAPIEIGEEIAVSSGLQVRAQALDESALPSTLPAFRPQRNRIVMKAAYVAPPVVARRIAPAVETRDETLVATQSR